MDKAYIDGLEIICPVRWAKNDRFYKFDRPTQKELDKLIKKYGIDQIVDTKNGYIVWLDC